MQHIADLKKNANLFPFLHTPFVDFIPQSFIPDLPGKQALLQLTVFSLLFNISQWRYKHVAWSINVDKYSQG